MLRDRRAKHVASVHRAQIGDELTVGIAGGRIGRGRVLRVDDEIELDVTLDRDPPAPLDITLVLALPRPKVLNRVIAAVTSLGIKRITLINAWRVEKSYWRSPRMSEENLREQMTIGLEQARDTIFPVIETKKLFRPFVENELKVEGSTALVAHPYASEPMPRNVRGPITLAIGPEGGFIQQEIDSLVRAGFRAVTLGERVLRVETAIATIVGRVGGQVCSFQFGQPL